MAGNLLQALGEAPVGGVSLANVSLLRLDQVPGPAPGNKSFKLHGILERARQLGVPRLVSFGGAWSNHLHALAAVGAAQGFETVGIVRGEAAADETAMLTDARRWGMRIVNVTRTEYRQRNDRGYQQQLTERFAPCLLIPEGGADAEGARGCLEIARMVRSLAPGARHIVLPVGTGTTLAGLAAGLDGDYEVTGISALKGASDLRQRVEDMLCAMAVTDSARWHILHEFHCGGFARTHALLRDFMLDFERVHGVPLDPVYTGKMLFAIYQLLQRGEWPQELPVLAIHTGGVQGRRGYPWLDPV